MMKFVIGYILASVYDLVLTLWGLAKGEKEEWNPIVLKFIDKFGNNGIIYYKVMVVTFIVLAAIYVYKFRPTLIKVVMGTGTIITILAASTWLL